MGSLANKKIGDSFKDLLQISNNNSGIDSTVGFISDGEGTQSVLGLDTSKITINGHILPTANAVYDIGSAEKKIRHLFLSDNSLYVGDIQLSSTDASNIKGLDDGTYATTAAMNAGMNTKADSTALNDYATTAAMDAGMATKVNSTALNDYATTAAMDAGMNTKADSSALNDYATKIQLDAKADITTLDDYATTDDMFAGLATKANTSMLNDYSTTAEVDDQLAAKADISTMLASLAQVYSKYDVDTKFNDYPTLSDVDTTIQNVIGTAPAALDTLAEIADALDNDANYAATVTSTLATKANASELANYATTSTLTNSYLRKDTSDTFIGKLSIGSTLSRSAGIYGTYDSYKIGHIWSIGVDYKIPDSGDNFGNLYGFAYKHVNNLTGGEMAGGHQAVWCSGGDPNVAIGDNIWARNNITAFSDARVKKNIETIPNAVDKVKAIRGVTYERTDSNIESENNVKQMGVIAQELVDVIPEVVTGGPTDTNPDGYYSVAYGNIVGLLIEAVKEQQVQLEEQKQLIDQLLNK